MLAGSFFDWLLVKKQPLSLAEQWSMPKSSTSVIDLQCPVWGNDRGGQVSEPSRLLADERRALHRARDQAADGGPQHGLAKAPHQHRRVR